MVEAVVVVDVVTVVDVDDVTGAGAGGPYEGVADVGVVVVVDATGANGVADGVSRAILLSIREPTRSMVGRIFT